MKVTVVTLCTKESYTMALEDPQSVTTTATHVLPRIYKAQGVGTFVSPNSDLSLEVRPGVTQAGRNRKVVALSDSKVFTDPATALPGRVSASVTLVIDTPMAGFTDEDTEKLTLGVLTWLTASTNKNLKKVVAGEN